MKFTSVVGYHMNPMTCGVAKFNAELAKRLGVPFVSLRELAGGTSPLYGGTFPLLSLKWSEIDAWPGIRPWTDYGVFWHDKGEEIITLNAKAVFYADPSLGSPGLWCPSLLTPSKPRTVRLFSWGMAHKIQTQHFAKVRQLLDGAGLDYRLRVSVGLHEGTSLDDATQHFDALKDIMGADKVTILGILSDDAVAEELQNADRVLAFFEKGVRANNTTVNAALDAGRDVITNRDERSPSFFYQDVTCICCIDEWPRRQGTRFSWEALILEMETLCEASASATA